MVNVALWKRLNCLQSLKFEKNVELKDTAVGDSMLQTSRSDPKINILNPNLNVKMFNKGVQTYMYQKVTLVFPLYLIKRCFSELSRAWRYELRKLCFRHYIFKKPFFKVTFFKDIFVWIFNLEQKIIVPSKHGDN